MKFLIVGLGSIGRRHMQNLTHLGESDIILLRTHHSTLPDDDLTSYTTETSLELALSHKPDAVIVSNPTSLHLEVAIPAALAGCHLLLEKPVSHSMDRVDELFQSVESGGGKVLVGYQYRFHPGLQIIKGLLKERAIGRPLTVQAHWGEYLPDWHPWEDYKLSYSARVDLGGGVILTLSHPLDYLRWLVGDVSEVWAFSGTLGDLDLETEDTAEIGLRFSNGVLGSLHLDYNQQPPDHQLKLIGTQGTIIWDYADKGVRIYTSEINEWQTRNIPDNFQRNDMFLSEMKHFTNLIQDKEESFCSLLDGVRALELAIAAKQAAKQENKIHLT